MEFLKELINLFIDMSFYIMIGLLMVGILNSFVNRKWIVKQVGKNNILSVIKAAVIGVPLPICSCGVVPMAVELKKSNASNGAVNSFLISTPQTGVDNIIATWGIIGPFMAIFRAVSAFISGIIGGIVTNIFSEDSIIEKEEESCCCKNKKKEEKKTFKEKVVNIFTYGFGFFLDEIVIHFIIGLIISTLITLIIPNDFFIEYGLNSNFISMIIMILVGLPMYVCSTSSIPIALSLMMKGINPGAAFVFLFVGPVTNMASLIILGKTFGKKLLTIYVSSVIVLSIIFGYIFNYIVDYYNINIMGTTNHLHSHGYSLLDNILAIIFLILIIFSLARVIKYKLNKI